ncbi:transporter substrate-binding domain-containing protein [Micromonospora sp. NPDC000207]|uniref:transporter substrate-binding domain-containing protein n=1 Tax=Micromonospora sp. NPDC000207 TaxID=3154246 RepID=UPI003322D8F8
MNRSGARRSRRRVSGAGLIAVLLLGLPACAAEAVPTAAPSAAPDGVREVAATGAPANDICTVRRSFAPSDRRPVISRGRLVVGVDPSDATMSHWDAQRQTFQGFNIDLVRAVAAALWPGERDPADRISFTVVPPGQGGFEMLTSGQIDMIATSLTATCARARQVVFSADYLDSGQTALVRRVDGRPQYPGMEHLGGRRVCAAARTTSLAAVTGYRTAQGRALVPVQAAHAIDCLVMLRQGQVDAVSTDENILLGFTRMAPDTVLVTEPPPDNARFCSYHREDRPCTWFTDEPHSFAFAPGNEDLVRFVNHVLSSPAGATVWQEAHDRWLDDHPDRGKPTPGEPVSSWPPD